MRLTVITCLALCITTTLLPASAQRVPRMGFYNHSRHAAKPLPAGREASMAAIANTYGLHMTPEATSSQLAENTATLTKVLAWVNTQSTLSAVEKTDMLAAIAKLQAENAELIAKAGNVTSTAPRALLPQTLH